MRCIGCVYAGNSARQPESDRHAPQDGATHSRREDVHRRRVRLAEQGDQLRKWESRVVGWATRLSREHNFWFDPELIPSRRLLEEHGYEIR